MIKIKERKLHLLVIAFLAGLFLGVNLTNYSGAAESAHKYLDYFHQVYQIIRTDYVEEVENKEVFYGAIRGMIKALGDPYSRFLDEVAFKTLMEETSGKFVGVGIEITIKNGEIVVISPIDGTPAMEAGIIAGDTIIKVDDKSVEDREISEIVKLIRGLPDTEVKLTVRREGVSEPIEFELRRTPIKIDTVNYSVIEEYGNIGYMKIRLFSANTPRDVEEALNFFNEKEVDKLIVDLRWNPGGLLDRAITTIDHFLERDKIIVTTRGREGTGNVSEFKAVSEPLFNGELIVLVNNGSASASEIFSGAIRDNSRGKLLGEKTFGKGSVQKFFSLDEDIGVTITISKYYTPSGISIHGKGIEPDYKVDLTRTPEGEKKEYSKIYKNKLFDDFVVKHRVYNEENRKDFYEFLEKNNISISKRSADFILKREIYKYTKSPMYDLEFDNQLIEAIKIIKKG